MRLLAAVQSILALAFVLFGLVALFGLGITGLGFPMLGAVFALTVGIVADQSRAGAAVALAVDAGLAYMAAHKLAALFAAESSSNQLQAAGFFDDMPAIAALVLVGVGALADQILSSKVSMESKRITSHEAHGPRHYELSDITLHNYHRN